MNFEPPRDELWRMVQRDHDIIAKGIASCRKMCESKSPRVKAAEMQALKRLLGKALPRHFSYEEDQVFPVLLATQPDPALAQSLAELGTEHIALLEEAGRLLSTLAEPGLLPPAIQKLKDALQDFFATLDRHSAKEDHLFMGAFGDLTEFQHC